MESSLGIVPSNSIVDEDEQISCTLNDGVRVVANVDIYC